MTNALDKQVGGNHYKKFKIQPVEFCHVNNIPYMEATAIKYLCRWRDKGGIADLDKAIHFIELLKELEGKYNEDIRSSGGSSSPVGRTPWDSNKWPPPNTVSEAGIGGRRIIRRGGEGEPGKDH